MIHLNVIQCARRRAHLAGAEGDRRRYWREQAAIAILVDDGRPWPEAERLGRERSGSES